MGVKSVAAVFRIAQLQLQTFFRVIQQELLK